MLRFKDAHPGCVLVMKNISDVVLRDSAGLFESNRDYSFLNKMVEEAKVVIKRDGHHAMLRHPDWDLIDRGGVDITIDRESRDIESFKAVPQQRSGDQKVSTMAWKGNVPRQYGRRIATGDHVTVLSNSDGFFMLFEEQARPSSYDAALAEARAEYDRTKGSVDLVALLFVFAREIYGALVRVEFVQKLREEQKYETLDALATAIRRDAERARVILSGTPA